MKKCLNLLLATHCCCARQDTTQKQPDENSVKWETYATDTSLTYGKVVTICDRRIAI